MNKPFEPKLITVLREGITFKQLTKDIWAGIIVGIVAFPLSIAFAIASGVKPEQGIITAVVAGFLISCFSGSRVQIGGPTGAFIVIVYDIVQKYGYEGLALATAMAGILLIAMGLARLGDVIKFIPYPVTVGFTTGIAVIIFTTQIRDFLGLEIAQLPNHFIDKIICYFENFHSLNVNDLMIGVATVLIIGIWRKVTDKLPGPLIAILVTAVIVKLCHVPVETIGTRFGAVPNHIPMPQLPEINFSKLVGLTSPAITIALLAGIESLLSAVVADGMTGRRHRSNMELIAQGVANIGSALFRGMPATGAIARTATNIKNGGETPIAGIIHAFTVLGLFLFLSPWAALIPMATLAGILIIVAYNMSEWRLFVKMINAPKSDLFVLLITFLLTVFVDLTVAIEVGVVFASFLFMKRMADVTDVHVLQNSLSDKEIPSEQKDFNKPLPKGVQIYEINGPFFFGAADKFKHVLSELRGKTRALIILMRHVPVMDATGLNALESLLRAAKKEGTEVFLCDVQPQPLGVLKKSDVVNKLIPAGHIVPDVAHALKKIENIAY